MNNRLALLNRRVKAHAKHLDITLDIDGIAVPATFERFNSYAYDEVAFTVKSDGEKPLRYKFTYLFTTGLLKCKNRTEYVEITDLFSNRNLQTILFFAREFAFMEKDMSTLTRRLHSITPVPELWTESDDPHQKKKFKIDHILKVTDRYVLIDGVLSITTGTDLLQPFYAVCKFTFKNELYSWSYQYDDRTIHVEKKEWCFGSFPNNIKMPSTILFAKACADLEESMKNDAALLGQYEWFENEMRKIMGRKKILLEGVKENPMGLPVLRDVLFLSIHSIDKENIIFSVCDGVIPSNFLTYYKATKQLFLPILYANRMYKEEVRIRGRHPNDMIRFEKVIKLINEKHPS